MNLGVLKPHSSGGRYEVERHGCASLLRIALASDTREGG